MKIKNKLFTRLAVSIMTSAMILSVTPMPTQNSIVTVEAAQKKPVKLSAKKLTLKKGTNKRLVLKNAKGKITWRTNKKSIATVSRKGLVKAKKKGKAVITATFNNRKYKCTVTVKDPRSNSTGNSNSSGGSGSGSSSGSSSSSKRPSAVYWTPSGQVYHVSRSCPTLSRSRVVYSGSISESGRSRACKVCS